MRKLPCGYEPEHRSTEVKPLSSLDPSPLLTGFREADCDCLLATRNLASLAPGARPQGPALLAVHCALHTLAGAGAVLSTAGFLFRCHENSPPLKIRAVSRICAGCDEAGNEKVADRIDAKAVVDCLRSAILTTKDLLRCREQR